MLNGLKTTLLSVLAVSFILFLIAYFKSYWTPWLSIIDNLPFFLFSMVILLSAQFNRSRLSFLSALWLLYYASSKYSLPWSDWLLAHQDWLILTGINCLLVISIIKDRGIFSAHTLSRLFLFVLCGGAASLWLWGHQQLVDAIPPSHTFFDLLKWGDIELVLAVSALVMLWHSLSQKSLLASALMVSFSLWVVNYYQLIAIDWSVQLTFLSSYYFVVVIIESYFLAYRDDLTNLPSRRALNQLALALSNKYCVAMLDIDHFKKFNDSYGHDIGDQVLKLVASKLAQVKCGGKVFRYGGEEFTIVFPRKDSEQAVTELERLRQMIADYQIVIRQPQRKTKQERKKSSQQHSKMVSVTISIGVATKAKKEVFEQVLKNADQALYRAKKKGRNNVSR